VIDKIRKVYVVNPEFTPAKAANASAAAEGLCKWIIAMEKYDLVAKVVAPKKAKLMAAEQQYENVMIGLKAKQADLTGILGKLQELEDDLDYNMLKKENLQVIFFKKCILYFMLFQLSFSKPPTEKNCSLESRVA
jgi:dynein heavy chain